MNSLDQRLVKVAVGLALEVELERGSEDSSVLDRLLRLYATPDLAVVKALHDELLGSDSFEDREVGLWLELALTGQQPDFDWRDVVMDIQETELDLLDLAYTIETSEYRNQFRAFGLLDWMDSLGSCVSNIRGGNWILAKIEANRAVDDSLAESVEKIRKSKDFMDKIDENRKAARSHLEKVLKLSGESNIPEDRLDTILDVQELLIEFKRKYRLEPADRVLSDVALYPIEKLGVAEDYLLDPKSGVEEAAYEVGLVSEYLKGQAENVRNPEIRAWVVKLQERVESLFSRMPAKHIPKPVEVFRRPNVESRFEKKRRGRSSLIR